ncbi:MAG: ABC transporter permease [Gammaproteobacteria bacterium]|nr:ABC transporter permease [Gammaproteobacteria bacterium]
MSANQNSSAPTAEEVLAQHRRDREIKGFGGQMVKWFHDSKYYFLGLFIILLIWQLVMGLGALGEDFSASFTPVATFKAFVEMVETGDLMHHTIPSLRRVAVGLGTAVIVAIPIGILIGYFKVLEQMTYIAFQFLRMVSPLAWMPIAIIIFGVGDKAVYFLLWLVAIWPLILNTAAGAGRVSQLWINMAKTMGATDRGIMWKIIIPAAIPDMLTGLRLAVGISWIILVPAEMLGVPDGLGYYILDTRDRFRYDQLMATIVTIGAIGYVLDTIMRMLIRRFAWKI